MICEDIKQHLGAFFDDEVSPVLRAEIEAHIAVCPGCASELNTIADLAAQLKDESSPSAPNSLWSAIESRLEARPPMRHAHPNAVRLRRYALAACLLLAIILGSRALFRHGDVEGVASAATVDFRVLLDGLSSDPVAAFERFLAQYHARPIDPGDARKLAAHLDFEIPQELPGEFRFEKSYALEFGGEIGIAARYSRGNEFLGAIFHRPVQREEFGTHKDYECVVGKHRGHAVAVGEWKLVHLTDLTTCHCVLSRLDEETELPAVLSAVAPRAKPSSANDKHSHSHRS